MSLTRYEISDVVGGWKEYTEPNGDWVKHADVAPLLEQAREALDACAGVGDLPMGILSQVIYALAALEDAK